MKNVENKLKWLKKNFSEEEDKPHRENREIRQNKRLYKKQYTKLLRRINKDCEDM